MTQDTQQQSQTAAFDLDAAINQRVADHLDSLAEKERKEGAERRQQLTVRRAECEQALAKAFPAELREALGMKVDENSVKNPASGYPVKGYPVAVFTFDNHLWHITLEYDNGVYINPPDGNGRSVASVESVDTLLLSMGLWREREAERARSAREDDTDDVPF